MKDSTLCYTAKSKKVALVVGHWELCIEHLGISNNAMSYLSDHQTIASQCAIPNAQATFIESAI